MSDRFSYRPAVAVKASSAPNRSEGADYALRAGLDDQRTPSIDAGTLLRTVLTSAVYVALGSLLLLLLGFVS